MNYHEFTKLMVEKIKDDIIKEKIDVEISEYAENEVVVEPKGLNQYYSIKNNIEDIYDYLNGDSFVECLHKQKAIYQNLHTALREIESLNKFVSVEKVYEAFNKGSLIFSLINAYDNDKLLMDVPYREYQDLAIVYRMVINDENGEILSPIIHNDLLKLLNFTENELYEIAYKNMERNYPIIIHDSKEEKFCIKNNFQFPFELKWNLKKLCRDEMYMLSNIKHRYGSAVILYDGVLETIAEELETDLYVIFTSINEVLVTTEEYLCEHWDDIEYVPGLVKDINFLHVFTYNRLSNQLYRYDRVEKVLVKVESNVSKSVLDY